VDGHADASDHSPVASREGGVCVYDVPSPMTHDRVHLERRQHGNHVVAEIRLDRPEKGNALTMAMIERLGAIVEDLARDRETRAIVLRAAGRCFCTGGDIAEWGGLTPNEMERDWLLRGSGVFTRLAALSQPVVAVIGGHALGGGLELAMAADLRLTVKSATFGCPEVTIGVIPGWMGTRRLAELIGPARARHLLLLGSPISAAQAYDWGLVTAVAADEADLEVQLTAWLDRLLANAPVAMTLVKGIVSDLHGDVVQQHASAAAEAAATEDCQEGVRAFLEKRPPVFRNR
jgi:enoyl-CoA hydratase